jgi:hypothetical protein
MGEGCFALRQSCIWRVTADGRVCETAGAILLPVEMMIGDVVGILMELSI